jgi:hypothetical protein
MSAMESLRATHDYFKLSRVNGVHTRCSKFAEKATEFSEYHRRRRASQRALSRKTSTCP